MIDPQQVIRYLIDNGWEDQGPQQYPFVALYERDDAAIYVRATDCTLQFDELDEATKSEIMREFDFT